MAGQAIGSGSARPRSFSTAASLAPSAAGFWLMPVRSPFTSAMNTGTPSRLKFSASVCSVIVLPVPVAPVISPWRLASAGQQVAFDVAVLGNQDRFGHRGLLRKRLCLGRHVKSQSIELSRPAADAAAVPHRSEDSTLMAGHSKWANIQHRKGRQDEKRGKVWTRVIREITVAARQGGGDLGMNPRLRLAVEKAKAANMPADTVKKNIDKATGNLEGVSYEEIRYEGYGIGGAAIIVDCMTDNRVRTVAEVRHAFSKYGGNLGTEGSVAFQFKHCGQFVFAPGTSEDKVMEVALEAGAEDVVTDDDGAVEVLCAPPDFEAVKAALEARRPEARGGRGDDARREQHRAGRRGRAAHAEAARRASKTWTTCRTSFTTPRSTDRDDKGERRMKVLSSAAAAASTRWPGSWRSRRTVQTVYVAPGNGGTARDPRLHNVAITDLDALADFAQAEKIALTVVGPEAPLAAGVVDLFRARGLRVFGPTQAAAQLESSKAFAKDFMQRHGIPTAALRDLHRRRRGARLCRQRRARRSSSRPTAWPRARAWWSPRRWPRRTRRSTGCCG